MVSPRRGHQQDNHLRPAPCDLPPYFTNPSIDDTSETFTNSTDESIRLINPVSTLPGPTSTKRFTPIGIIFSTDSPHRTGEATWRSSALRTAVAGPIGEASTFETSA